jgi:hypothetical protein
VASDRLAIVHDIPGRLRVRLPSTARSEGLESAVKQLRGVVACRWSPQTRSLLTLYQSGEIGADEILETIGDRADVDVDPAARPGLGREPAGPALAAATIDAVTAVDQRLRQLTGGALALRVLVPLALVLWAVRDLARGSVNPLPWSSALWYAHGLFRDYTLPGGD